MNIKSKFKVGILGATGMVGQRFMSLLEDHPWFEVSTIAASPQSAGKKIRGMSVLVVDKDKELIAKKVDFVFCALSTDKRKTQQIEEAYASLGVPVISNNSAHRWTQDVPMLIPEVNTNHIRLIDVQRKNRGWTTGFIAVKPNCSIQSYVIVLTALAQYKPVKLNVTSFQAISGAGKTFSTWPEMIDNVIPFISAEEEKSEKEPLKIWGTMQKGKLKLATKPLISATCIRAPVSEGHMASIQVTFAKNPTRAELIETITSFKNPLHAYHLPSSPKHLLCYFEDESRPQTKLDRDLGNGMSISVGRLRKSSMFDWSFISLSHNTIRGAAGGAILMAELLVKKSYIVKRTT